MTDQATTTTATGRNAAPRRTRRQLLAGGTGALAAALTADALARPAPALADNGHNVILGQANAATATTAIQNGADSSGQAALRGIGTGATAGLSGVSDSGTGVHGDAPSGTGVQGSSGSGTGGVFVAAAGKGVYGQSGTTASKLGVGTNGVHGITDNPRGFGVVGENYGGGTAVSGIGGDFGVIGTSNPGVGVLGAGGEAGVRGVNDGFGPGVHGDSFNGIGVLATGTQAALSVQGPAMFSRSGVLTVRRGRSSAVHALVPISRRSLVLAIIQQDLDGVWVRSAVPGEEKFTVHLNKAAPTDVKVAWFVVN